MIVDAAAQSGTFETRADAGEGSSGLVRLWLEAIDLASKEERKWRERAQNAIDIYSEAKQRKGRAFPILYSNVETLAPSLYNSTPSPDVRRRFRDNDPLAKLGAQVLERALSFSVDAYDFDRTIKACVKHVLLPGRGVARVRYAPIVKDDQIAYQSVECEPVPWADFRHGPAQRWQDVPWIAFRHTLTRDQLRQLNPDIGEKIPLDMGIDGTEQREGHSATPDIFKRAEVWEVWDKERRRVLFLSRGWPHAPIRDDDDVLRLEQFFPIPRPIYAIDGIDSLVPLEEYYVYRDQADELERITQRINGLLSVLKWRGVADARLASVLTRLETARDGTLIPGDELQQFSVDGGLDRAIWLMPIDQAILVVEKLYEAREQIKRAIYEITGIADILRGVTNPQETLGAQRIKAQWGSLRVQDRQTEVQRFCRDIFRLKAEIIANHFSMEQLSIMTGIAVDEKLLAFLRDDVVRAYRIDIETDSTIQADTSRAQQTMGDFVQGLGAYITAIGPAVQAGVVPMDVAADLLSGFSRQFKLGKQAEDALDRLSQSGADAAAQPRPDPGAAEQAKLQAETTARAAETEAKTSVEMRRLDIDAEQAQAKTVLEGERLKGDAAKAQSDAELKAREIALKERELSLREREASVKLALEASKILDGQDARGEAREAAMERAKPQMDAQAAVTALAQTLQEGFKLMMESNAATQQSIAEAFTALADTMKAPREIVRGPDGRASGVRLVA
ncbi:MAG: cell envelope integrity protein TolA [Armatimonadetes bacterium]|nr:cell envelope integrity protein TolA [Armatimonadota bacterium]